MNMKLLTSAAACALALSATFAAQDAMAAAITINSTTPSWSNTVGGTNVNTGTSGFGNNTITYVAWGRSTGDGQSGLGFDPANPPASTYQTDTTFLLGTLTHYNNPVGGGTAASSTVLNLLTNIASATPSNQTFSYRLDIDETVNEAPCAYPSGSGRNFNPCADRITFVNLDPSNSFSVGGVSYTIELLGFSSNNGNTISSGFISQEGGTNDIGLYARITAPTPVQVPEPMSLALFGSGLLGLGLVRRQRNKA